MARSGLGANTYLPPGECTLGLTCLDASVHIVQGEAATPPNRALTRENAPLLVTLDIISSPYVAVHASPPCPSMKNAREEFEHVMFSCVEDLLKKTGACITAPGCTVS